MTPVATKAVVESIVVIAIIMATAIITRVLA